MQRITVKVRDLRQDDLILPTGKTVEQRPYQLHNTPGRQRYVRTLSAKGIRVIHLWNADTTMTVLRED